MTGNFSDILIQTRGGATRAIFIFTWRLKLYSLTGAGVLSPSGNVGQGEF